MGQSQVAKIGVAVSERWKDRNGQVQESAEYFDVEIWDKAGVYPYLTKGQPVLIVGSQKTDRWQDQNGQNRESKKVRAQVVQLCGSKPQGQASPAPQQQYRQPAPPPQYNAPAPPAPPQYAQPPVPPQPGQPGNPQYPPMNSPEYTGYNPEDLPPEFM